MYILIPHIGYRMTLKYSCNCEYKAAHNNEGQDGPTLDSKGSCREDLKVEYQDRNLDEADCYNVEDFAEKD